MLKCIFCGIKYFNTVQLLASIIRTFSSFPTETLFHPVNTESLFFLPQPLVITALVSISSGSFPITKVPLKIVFLLLKTPVAY